MPVWPEPMAPTWRARLLNLLAWFIRPLIFLLRPHTKRGVQMGRALIEWGLTLTPVDPRAQVTPQFTCFEGQPIGGEWVRGRGVEREDAAILYLHGSGYVFCSPRSHRPLVAQLSAASGLPAFSLDYRLAPEHRFPAAAEDTLAAYRWLLDSGLAPERIIVAGDSAGGHLALGLARELERDGLPQPAGLVLLSPLVDHTFEVSGAGPRARRDPFFHRHRIKPIIGLYTGDADHDDIRLALRDFDAAALPPMLVQAGGAELLCADSEELARIVNGRGGSCRLVVWPGQLHVFQTAYAILPEARQAIRQAGEWMANAIAAPTAAQPPKDRVA